MTLVGRISTVALALLLAVSVAVGEETTRLRLVDGTTVPCVGDPEFREDVVVYRTPEGWLASLPAEKVAEVVREIAATAETEAPDPEAVRTYTNEDLPVAPLPMTVEADLVRAPTTETDVPVPTYDTYRDRDGHDEAYWRGRVAGLAERRADARDRLEEWRRRHAELSEIVDLQCNPGQIGSPVVNKACAAVLRQRRDAQGEMIEASERLKRIDAERLRIEREAREAGALPAWFR